jgi:thiol-disulfide isomerase/thioredoxin
LTPQPVPQAAFLSATGRFSPVTRVVVVVIAVVLVVAGISRLVRNTVFPSVYALQPSETHASATHPCLMKSRCVVVYLAPWCPYCNRSIGTIQELRAQWKDRDVGILPVIGRDTVAEIQAMAARVGEGSYVDLDASFFKKTGVQGVPAWFLINDQGKLLKTFLGAPGNAPTLLAELELK